jgi:hypothetical protein
MIYNINEFTLPGFLISALLGRNPVVLAVDPLFPPFRRFLEPLVNRTIAKGRARWIIDLCPDQQHLWEYPTRTFLFDVFGQTEAWHNKYYSLNTAEQTIPDYAMAYKHVTCNHARFWHYRILLLGPALDAHAGKPTKVTGLPGDAVGMMQAYWGERFDNVLKPLPSPRWPINTVVTILIMVYALAWIIFRTRPIAPKPEEFFFGADYYEDVRDFRLYHEVADGGPLLLVLRHPKRQHTEPHDELKPYKNVSSRDGRYGPLGAVCAMAMVVMDGARLLRHFGGRQTALYYRVATLPFRRAVLRAFFNRFHLKFYWGRDDYNEEHILRRQELHRVGGRSFGINHGYSHYANFYPAWRYISFDRFYAFGMAQYNRYMKETWAKDMVVVPAGSFGASREDYARRLETKPRDIAVFVSSFILDEKMTPFVRALGEAFPERTIWLQVKSFFVDRPCGQKFLVACQNGLTNVKHTREPVFDMFPKASYTFSDPSTVIVEALQFGCMSFMADVSRYHKDSLHREFPGLCVTSGEEAVIRIRSIEDGTWQYPRDSYGELIDLSGRVFFDIIREDIGLPSKESQV